MGVAAFHSDWLVPDWPAPSSVKAVFTTRQGGSSAVPYDSMNLGDHVGDGPPRVADNRARLGQTMHADPVFMQQVHGTRVLVLEENTADAEQADAAFTTQPAKACTIMVADCLPVLLSHADGSAVAAAHAGWRGLAGQQGRGVLEAVFECFRPPALMGRTLSAINTIAWLGPCIGPEAFEVGEEVRQAFLVGSFAAAGCFVATGSGKYLANLPALARLRLEALGITQVYGNDGSAPWCTVGNPSRFFSHRRDAGLSGNGFGTTGRMAACIWRE